MERDLIAPPADGFKASPNRRALLRYGIGLGAMAPVVGTAAAAAVAQDAPTATPGVTASPAASPTASPAASPTGSPTAAVTVQMTTRLRFEPAHVTVKLGETITWVNAGPIPHTTTCDPEKNPVQKTRPEVVRLPPGGEPWDSGLLNRGQAFSHTFAVAGEYAYFCIPHVLSGMLGTITVEG